MTTHFLGDTAVLTGRALRHITRSLDTIITTAITPIGLMLLLVHARCERILLPADLPAVHQLRVRAHRHQARPPCAPSPRTSRDHCQHDPRPFAGQPVSGDVWAALAWCVGILLVTYASATAVYRRKIT